MLGTLPSTYLKWVSSNLRARDFEDWAKLADQVLVDPVYQDRVEWEFAQKVLNGDVLTSPLSSSSSGVSSLLEISDRFGWDNEDKLGWSKLNFELLGTSNGGRIPRIKEKGAKINSGKEDEEESGSDEDEVELGERRGERRARLKLKRRGIKSTSQRLRAGSEGEEMKNPAGKIGDSEFGKNSGLYNRFPGREGLLRIVMDAKGKRPSL